MDYRHRRRPRRRRGVREPEATARGRAASASPATWCPTTWASTRAGWSSTPTGSSRARQPPYPGYSFNGPDLSRRPARRHLSRGPLLRQHRRGRRRSSASIARPATTRYIYHGNDGTSMPWNDTAQLDYLKRRGARGGHPDHPPRRAPVPDHPLRRGDDARQAPHRSASGSRSPGSGGAIPSRAEYAHDARASSIALMPDRVLARGRRPRRRARRPTRCSSPRRSG